MNRPVTALILAALCIRPVVAAAQTQPQAPAPAATSPAGGPGMGPPPAERAKMDAMRAQAKSDAYAALSADHRTRVQAIVAQVAAGTLEPRAAAQQIDALLTPDEQRALAAVEQKQREQMRLAFAGPGGGPPPDGPPPGGPPPSYVVPGSSVAPPGPPPDAAGPGGRAGHHRQTPGGFLLRLSLSPDQMHAMGPRPPASN